MNAGRELDSLIAEKVFGLSPDECGQWFHSDDGVWRSYPELAYSADIAAAWMVVEKLGNWRGFTFLIIQHADAQHWQAGWYELDCDGYESRISAEAETVPLAICLAALKVAEED